MTPGARVQATVDLLSATSVSAACTARGMPQDMSGALAAGMAADIALAQRDRYTYGQLGYCLTFPRNWTSHGIKYQARWEAEGGSLGRRRGFCTDAATATTSDTARSAYPPRGRRARCYECPAVEGTANERISRE